MTAQAEYAVAALVELALEPEETSIRSPEIARRLEAPAASLEQVMVRLRRHGFVKSFRGASGGYALARSPHQIRLGDVLGVFLPTREGRRDPPPEEPGRLVVREQLDELESRLTEIARGVTIDELARRSRERNEVMSLMPGL